MGVAFSVNGTLISTYESTASVTVERSMGYTQVAVGVPLVVRYLRFRAAHAAFRDFQKQQVMISTFIKTREHKEAEAEAVTLYDPDLRVKDGAFELTDFGAHRYGHPLCYYTKAYAGESVRLTTRIMELNKSDVMRAIKEVLDGVTGVPVFAEMLPYAAAAKAGASIIGKILDWLTTDTPIVRGEPLDLEHRVPNTRVLQSGRYVIAPALTDEQLIKSYRLSDENVLLAAKAEPSPYAGTYWTLQVNATHEPRYEGFDHFVKAAEILGKANRKKSVSELARDLAAIAADAGDIVLINKIEDMRFEDKTPEVRARIDAYYKQLSPEMKQLYAKRVEEVLGPPPE